MSRATRPLRRVRGADRDRLREEAWTTGYPTNPAWSLRPALIWHTARRWRCRPAQLRRCLLGLPVSARAAQKILAARSGRNIRREPGR